MCSICSSRWGAGVEDEEAIVVVVGEEEWERSCNPQPYEVEVCALTRSPRLRDLAVQSQALIDERR